MTLVRHRMKWFLAEMEKSKRNFYFYLSAQCSLWGSIDVMICASFQTMYGRSDDVCDRASLATVLYNCSADEFACLSTGACIELSHVCDNVVHCDDSSDETFCINGTSSRSPVELHPATQSLPSSCSFYGFIGGMYTSTLHSANWLVIFFLRTSLLLLMFCFFFVCLSIKCCCGARAIVGVCSCGAVELVTM